MTILTIDADFDGDVKDDNTGSTTGSVLRYQATSGGGGDDYDVYLRFPLAALPLTSAITQVDLQLNVVDAGESGHQHDIQGYNQDGQADPESDSLTLRRTRCEDDGTPYISAQTGLFTSTGISTVTLGSAAITDVANAKTAVNRFSIGMAVGTGFANATEFTAEDAGTNDPKLIITYTRTVDIRQAYAIPYRPAPDPDTFPEVALALAGALPKILQGTWIGERILWHDVWTLDAPQIEHLIISRASAPNSPGARTLYAITADGIYYVPIGGEDHPAIAPWPLTQGTPHAKGLSGNDFGRPMHAKTVQEIVIQGQYLQGDDQLFLWYHWSNDSRWRKAGPYSGFPVIINDLEGGGEILYAVIAINDATRDALAPYFSRVEITKWTDEGPIHQYIGEDFASPQLL